MTYAPLLPVPELEQPAPLPAPLHGVDTHSASSYAYDAWGDDHRPRRRVPWKVLLMFTMLCAGMYGAFSFGASRQDVQAAGPVVVGSVDTASATSALDAQRIYELRAPSVLALTAQFSDGSTMNGTGFVWDDQGNVVTNHHVIVTRGMRALKVTATLHDGRIVEGSLRGTDPVADIGVVRFTKLPLDPIPLASERPKTGAPVAAIGQPHSLPGTLTTGIVSLDSRRINSITSSAEIPDAIQTDAAINKGSSGSPLLDSSGLVVGLVAQIRSENRRSFDGVAFAIPTSTLLRHVPEIITNGKTGHAWLGVRPVNVLNQPGAYVQEALAGSVASKAGLISGDVITHFNGTQIISADDLLKHIDSSRPGATIELTWTRSGHAHHAKVRLMTRTS